MKIYTKTGDKGETSLYTGQRIAKDDPLIEALGTVDECNCAIGCSLSLLSEDSQFTCLRQELETIQHALFDLGAALATPRTRAVNSKLNTTRFDHSATELLEKWIDAMEARLPPLKTFILPGGNPAGAMLHLARSICRRAERRLLPPYEKADVSDTVIVYLNRLSDYLFVASRYLNFLSQTPETLWEHHKTIN